MGNLRSLAVLAGVFALCGLIAAAQGTMAKSPPTYAATCAAAASVDPATAHSLCDAVAQTLAAAGWVRDDATRSTRMRIDVMALRPTSLHLSLTVTRADGRSEVIDRALSASDARISPAMQARFLQRLIAAIPTEP